MIKIEADKTYEIYSKIPKNLIFRGKDLPLYYNNYNLQPAKRLDQIQGLITIAYLSANNYLLNNKKYHLGNRKIQVAIQQNNIIPLLRLSNHFEKQKSKYWPILK